jgi:chromosome transmission fidelity protein 1
VFVEPTDSMQVETVLKEYATELARVVSSVVNLFVMKITVASQGEPGALLLAVVGAKLSEGLNFADDLARAVVIVGLPFANAQSPELQERMKYMNRLDPDRAKKSGGKDAAMELYENMCMTSVNQSIGESTLLWNKILITKTVSGRAIRHQRDWATLILLDKRYASPSIHSKLPVWISERLEVVSTFGLAGRRLAAFYRSRK